MQNPTVKVTLDVDVEVDAKFPMRDMMNIARTVVDQLGSAPVDAAWKISEVGISTTASRSTVTVRLIAVLSESRHKPLLDWLQDASELVVDRIVLAPAVA